MRPKGDKLGVQHWTLNNFTLIRWLSTVTFQFFVNQFWCNQLFGRSAVISLSLCWSDVNPLRKASLDTGAGLKHLPSHALWEKLHLKLELVWSILFYKSFKKAFIWDWIWFEASCLSDPLTRLHLRLKLVWSILLYRSFKKGFIWSWIWFDESFSFTNPWRNASFDLVWSISLYRSFKKGFIWGCIWCEASSFLNH